MKVTVEITDQQISDLLCSKRRLVLAAKVFKALRCPPLCIYRQPGISDKRYSQIVYKKAVAIVQMLGQRSFD